MKRSELAGTPGIDGIRHVLNAVETSAPATPVEIGRIRLVIADGEPWMTLLNDAAFDDWIWRGMAYGARFGKHVYEVQSAYPYGLPSSPPSDDDENNEIHDQEYGAMCAMGDL